MRPKECDIILGSDCFFEILRSGKIVGSKNEPIAQRTMFGWVVAGKLNVQNKEPNELYSHFLSTENDLKTDSLLQRFWETEELSVKKQFLSDEELFCEDHFQSILNIMIKCSFLSQSARLFDPLGFLTPCTVSIKIFYQQLWLLKLDWDSPLPDTLATKWKIFQKEFEQVCSTHIPKWIHTASQQVTLHGFVMRSELAYASVIYAVQPQADGNTKVTLLVAKSRVAPLKPVSIPRLELNGALLLARLYATCKNIFKEYDVHLYAWTDSQVVLSWLSSHPRNWKPYIANRTSEILDLVPADSWRYVPTKMNPADIASRGLSPKELPRCGLWWEGPQWLSCGMDSWPKQPKRDDQTSLVTRERKRTAFSFPVYRATTSKQLMGDLPAHRVTPSRPFSACGVDYAGPINVLRYRGRGARTTKGYIALFLIDYTKCIQNEANTKKIQKR
ncbi:DUF1758 domain-containing protein [Trichonephila clavata]|uniref:DUF1758 domain-containing protein n=1 Tax=Trichonephila clavata TaxID=2740835 RepID=A0A8X6JI44_TRICU|nr:DUF1758 domain-containing protein [Trichonephila clavata]